MLRILLPLMLLLCLPLPAAGQFSRTVPMTEVDYPETAWAVTVCGTRPLTWYNDEMPESVRGMVEVHEAAHRRQMEKFLSCSDFRAWRRESDEHNVIWEAVAFCAGARHDVITKTQPSLMTAVWAHARVFAAYSSWSPEQAASAIYRYCGMNGER